MDAIQPQMIDSGVRQSGCSSHKLKLEHQTPLVAVDIVQNPEDAEEEVDEIKIE